MDTLFRLVSFHQQQQPQQQPDPSLNSTTSRTSSSSRSSRQNYYPYSHQEEEECFNFYMDEEDLSSSSSKHYYHPYQPHHHQQHNVSNISTNTFSTTPNTDYSYSYSFSPTQPVQDFNFEFSSPNWSHNLLLESARAVADNNSTRLHHLLWMLNELSSPYGDTEQKLAAYFLRALFSRVTEAGDRTYRSLASASEKTCSFESTRKTVLKFQEPRIVTVVEEEADLDVGIDGYEFVKGFEESLRWFRVYFEALDDVL
ncbi:Protein SHORT-ROOT [Glycine soja]|uniref:Protein SHORT-ROOT n=1 Tax=Glycine soja TaxID=3848 RepID=A0A0B2QUE6_GLYSO|nr:Protein SHORT-ROOT [Glycine soja]